MGVSADGILAYGYDLGGEDSGWKIQGFDRWEDDTTKIFPWYQDEDDDDGLAEQANQFLLKAHGFTGKRHSKEATQAEVAMGVGLIAYCSYDYPGHILAVRDYDSMQGHVVQVNVDVDPGWREKLQWALTTLGIQPIQQEPAWLLSSLYSQ